MHPVEVSHIAKTFGSVRAVDDVSFDVQHGEIFGLLGPNGAGKTTSLRVMLDIFKPDSGTVSILGGPMDEDKKERIGYMPEDRGLYQDAVLERCLVYLSALKGLARHVGGRIETKGVRQVQRPVEALTARELGRLVRAVENHRWGPEWLSLRNAALIAVTARAGLRVGEAVALDIGDVELNAR